MPKKKMTALESLNMRIAEANDPQQMLRDASEAECALVLVQLGFEIQDKNGKRATVKDLEKVIAREKRERKRKRGGK